MESFDDLIRRKLADRPVPEFEERDWLAAERLLDEADRKKRRGWLFFLLPLAGMLVGGLAVWAYCSMKNGQQGQNLAQKATENSGGRAAVIEKQPGQLGSGDTIFENSSGRESTRFEKENPPAPAQSNAMKPSGLSQKGPGGQFDPRSGTRTSSAKGRSLLVSPPTILGAATSLPPSEVAGEGANSSQLPPGGVVAVDATNGQATAVDSKTSPLAARSPFLLAFLNEKDLGPLLVLKPREPRLVFLKAAAAPTPTIKKDRPHTLLGLESGGFIGQKDGLKKRTNGGHLALVFERRLTSKIAAQASLGYRLVGGLGQPFAPDTQTFNHYRFGLDSIRADATPLRLHTIVPGAGVRFRVFKNNWAEAGLAGQICYGSQIRVATATHAQFDSLGFFAPGRTTRGFSSKNLGWNKFVPETRLGWGIDFGRGLSASAGWVWQMRPLGKTAAVSADSPVRYRSRSSFDLRIRYFFIKMP